MAVTFNGVDSLLKYAGAIASSMPLTMFCYAKGAGSGDRLIMGTGRANGGDYVSCGIGKLSGTGQLYASHRTPGSARSAVSSVTVGSSDFVPVSGIYLSTGTHVRAGSSATLNSETTARTDNTSLHEAFFVGHDGRVGGGTLPTANIWSGDIGEVALWSSELSSSDLTALHGGALPETISPSTLIDVWDLQTYQASGNYVGRVNGTVLVASGTLAQASTHPITRSTAANAVTLNGPTSGTVNVASTNFTVGANGTISGTVVVTPSDGGAGGTFNPTTVSITSASPTATFTYTPSTTGSRIISVTNNGSLTNPSSISYTSNAAPATAITLSGPSTSVVGQASSNYTVGTNGAITGTVVVTPSDGGDGGTFTPTSVSISSGTPTATFTYTAASAGAKTISVTNNGSLTNPSAVTTTASVPAATAITLSGPNNGTVNTASTNFTVGANGTITGTITVTPSDAGNGGTFTPTSVQISSGTPTATFTYTPATTGVKTISVTNNGSLSNPSNISYTSNASAATAITLTGPSTSNVGQASSNYTVAANGTISGTVVVTPSDNGGGGSFTPTTVSISAASPTATFTYTAASAGAKTISVTNNGSLTNPSSITTTASVPAATAVTMTGPTSGTAGTASTNFTVGANGTISGTVVVTPSDGGAGGTFNPTTVSISSASPTATFTYTASSAGAKTISATNNGGLSNPSNITFTAASGAVGTINWPHPIVPINGTPRLSAGHRIAVYNMTTDALVVKKTGLVTNATTGVPPSISDALIVAGAKYRCALILDSDNEAIGVEFITAV